MPIAFHTSERVSIERSNLSRCVPIYDSDSSSSSSTIGGGDDSSEDSSDKEDSGENEVRSSFKGPLETTGDLENELPVRRGISNFYGGKSRSFTSLADVANVNSIKDIAKPEDPYARKRKNLLAHKFYLSRNQNCPLKKYGGGLSKRPSDLRTCTSGFSLSDSSSCSSNEGRVTSSPPSVHLPPLHPNGKRFSTNGSSVPSQPNSPFRSFSLSDLQCACPR